jgi:chromosomal replication initiator protein
MRAWDNFLSEQAAELGSDTIQKWLKPLKVVRFDACNLYLEAKDTFQLLWFEEHIRKLVDAKLVNNNNHKIKVHLALPNAPSSKASKGKRPAAKEPSAPAFTFTFNEPDPHCTFEFFKLSESNQLPFTLLSELTEKLEASAYNPVYISGESGSGKTHLLSAAAHDYKKKGLKVIFVHAETFTEHVVSAIRAGAMSAFRQAYRHADVLIVDNVHLFSRKGATQEEFFHTFNTLHLAGKQILLSANCLAQELTLIEPRLVSRFEWGIALSLEPLKREQVAGLLQAKAASFSFELSPKIADFLTETFSSNTKAAVRALEALILRTHMHQAGRHTPLPLLNLQLVKLWLADLISEEEKAITTSEMIVQSVAEHYGMRSEDLLGKGRTRDCLLPRKIAMFLCREKLRIPFAKIGTIFSKDHSTVMTSIKQINQGLKAADKELQTALAKIAKKLSF